MHKGITFVCPSYNHEKYIGAFIESVLAQTCPTWELIIVDDCSQDGNLREAESYIDERIRIIKHPFNMGIQVGLMEGAEAASYDIVTFIASDDLLMPQYVEKVLKHFEAGNFGVLYTPLQFIDHDGKPCKGTFDLPVGKSKEEIFVASFLKGNQVPSPGMAIKKDVLKQIFPIHTGLLQYQDSQLHVLLMYCADVFMCPEALVWYRQTPGSACKPSVGNQLRSAAETNVLMDTVVQLVSRDTDSFLRYFGSRKNPSWPVRVETIPLHLAWIAMQSPDAERRRWAVGTIMELISTPKKMQALYEICGFSFKDYIRMPESFASKQISEKQKKRMWRAGCIASTILLLITLSWNIFRNLF